MIVQDIPQARLRQLLRGPGLKVRTGPLVNCIRSRLEAVAAGIALNYARHTVEAEDAFADFHIGVERPRTLRRWFEPQVVFRFDGALPFNPLPGHQGLPLLEWGLNWCVYTHCHQYLTMHSAVVEKGGLAMILPAPSGSGKSTLCAALAFRGWRLLSDELAVIDPNTGLVTPLPRPISLKNKSIDVIAAFAPEAVFSPTVPDTIKGSVGHVRPPQDAVERGGEAARPRWVVVPKYVAGAPATLQPLSRARAFMTLVDHTFNYNVHGREGFLTLASLIDGCDCYEFSYGDLDQAIALFHRLAEATPALP